MGLFTSKPITSYSVDEYMVMSSKKDKKERLDDLALAIADDIKNNTIPDKKIPFTLEYTVKYLKEENGIDCFATGSRVFGCQTSESDYDLVINMKDNGVDFMNMLGELYGKFTTEESDYNSGSKLFFGHWGNKCINIIPLSTHDYLYWMLATHSIANMSRINPKGISNKTVRVSTFEMMKGLARLIVGNEVTPDTIKKYQDMLKKDENIIISKFQYNSSKKKDNNEE